MERSTSFTGKTTAISTGPVSIAYCWSLPEGMTFGLCPKVSFQLAVIVRKKRRVSQLQESHLEEWWDWTAPRHVQDWTALRHVPWPGYLHMRKAWWQLPLENHGDHGGPGRPEAGGEGMQSWSLHGSFLRMERSSKSKSVEKLMELHPWPAFHRVSAWLGATPQACLDSKEFVLEELRAEGYNVANGAIWHIDLSTKFTKWTCFVPKCTSQMSLD